VKRSTAEMRTLLGRLRMKRDEFEKDGVDAKAAEYSLRIDSVEWAVGDGATELGQIAKAFSKDAVVKMPGGRR
jgi:hypothetical protein